MCWIIEGHSHWFSCPLIFHCHVHLWQTAIDFICLAIFVEFGYMYVHSIRRSLLINREREPVVFDFVSSLMFQYLGANERFHHDLYKQRHVKLRCRTKWCDWYFEFKKTSIVFQNEINFSIAWLSIDRSSSGWSSQRNFNICDRLGLLLLLVTRVGSYDDGIILLTHYCKWSSVNNAFFICFNWMKSI